MLGLGRFLGNGNLRSNPGVDACNKNNEFSSITLYFAHGPHICAHLIRNAHVSTHAGIRTHIVTTHHATHACIYTYKHARMHAQVAHLQLNLSHVSYPRRDAFHCRGNLVRRQVGFICQERGQTLTLPARSSTAGPPAHPLDHQRQHLRHQD